MLRCEKCKVSLAGSPESCPLCQGDLNGKPDFSRNVFPSTPMNNSRDSLLKTVTTSTIILSVLSLAINMMFPEKRGWSSLIIAVMISLWISFYFIMKNKKKLPKNIFFQVIILSLLSDSWDSFAGYHRWSTTYVVPILISSAIITIFIMAIVKNMYVGDYVFYLLMLSILGIIHFRYLTSSEITMLIPSTICFAISSAAILLLLLFKYRDIWSEIKRRLHF